MSFRTLEQQNAAIGAARAEQARKFCIANVYGTHQDFVRCEANDRAIIGVIERYIGPDVVPTSSLFEDALALNPDEIKSFARTTLATAMEQVVEEYITLLAAHSRQSGHTLKMERQKMLNMSLAEARERLNSLKTRQQMAAMPVAELHKIVQDAQPNYGFPKLPAEIWENGGYVKVDANYIRSADVYTVRRLNKLYGTAAVNARLNSR
jgi:hypothetical protein